METDWDFKNANTKEYTHCIHTYPAMMIPQIARRLISLYGKDAKIVLDPFMGSGTSLVESSLVPHITEVHGFDLNPLAVLIAKVKTTPQDIKELQGALNKILNSKEHKGLPQFKNIEYWFKPNVTEKLAILKTAINNIKNKDAKNFFFVVFSETVRNVSNTRNNEFKLYRIAPAKLSLHKPAVFKEFERIAKKNIDGLSQYLNKLTNTKIVSELGNTMNNIPLEENSVNLIVTSPPYGDSRTTVAYGQFSRLALQWLGYQDANTLDKQMLGGVASRELDVKINSPTLKKTINQIATKDKKRAKEVLSFYEDFDECVGQINKVMAKGGHVCFVVGNRTVKGINIPTDKIMIEMFRVKGNYKYITTYLRTIPNKRMPKANSPTNVKGKTVTTMNNEFIFILQKEQTHQR